MRTEVSLFRNLPVYCWTDSQISLSWIVTPVNDIAKREVFIANRVRSIQKLTSDCIWNYVPSSENPSDLATRPIMRVENLVNCELWFNGPTWLSSSKTEWPCRNDRKLSEIIAPSANVTMVTDADNLLAT